MMPPSRIQRFAKSDAYPLSIHNGCSALSKVDAALGVHGIQRFDSLIYILIL